jgi:tetratricopeptide (TPR) repeat protein
MTKIFSIVFLLVALCSGSAIAQSTDGSRAYMYYELKEYDRALNLADSMMVKDPNEVDYVLFKAMVLKAAGKPEDGNKLIDRYYKDSDDHSAAFYAMRGHKKAVASLYNESIDDYDKAYKKRDSHDTLLRTILMGRGQARYAIREYKSIYTDMQVLLAKDSTDYDAIAMMVNVLNWLNDTTQIMIYLERGVRLYPDNSLLIGNLAYRYQNMGRYKMAIELNTKAIELDSTSTYNYNNRGYEKYKLNDFVGAMQDINIALSKDYDNSFAYKNRALVYLAIKQTARACEDLQTALDKGFTEQYGPEVKDLISKNCQ